MRPQCCLAALSLAFATALSTNPFELPSGYNRFGSVSEEITWKPCYEGRTECGRFEVPLDKKNATAGKASLAVIRHRATEGNRLGTLFLNPGGPGIIIVKLKNY
jgi:hypothetical protein